MCFSTSTPSTSLAFIGTPSQTPPNVHPCCLSHPIFWTVTLKDHETSARAIIRNVAHVGAGDAVELTTDFAELLEGAGADVEATDITFSFQTAVVKVEEDARLHMIKFFPQLHPTPDAVVCLGELVIENLEFDAETSG